jgi:hypothetical protein
MTAHVSGFVLLLVDTVTGTPGTPCDEGSVTVIVPGVLSVPSVDILVLPRLREVDDTTNCIRFAFPLAEKPNPITEAVRVWTPLVAPGRIDTVHVPVDVVQVEGEMVASPVLDHVTLSLFTGTPPSFAVTVAVTGSFVPW